MYTCPSHKNYMRGFLSCRIFSCFFSYMREAHVCRRVTIPIMIFHRLQSFSYDGDEREYNRYFFFSPLRSLFLREERRGKDTACICVHFPWLFFPVPHLLGLFFITSSIPFAEALGSMDFIITMSK